MNIAQFFITIGIKGADVTKKSVDGIGDRLSNLKSTSLETKAAIVAFVYAMQQMMANSIKSGQSLSMFADQTGLSIEKLQKWQFAAKMAGASAEDFESTVKGVQATMAKMAMGEGAPKGLGLIASTLHLTPEDYKKMQEDTFFLMEKMNQFAKTAKPQFAREILNSMGVSDSVFAAMRGGFFNEKNFAMADTYSQKEARALQNVGGQWVKFQDVVDKAFGRFNVKHGSQIVSDLTKITAAVARLADALMNLSDKLHAFEFIGKAVDAAAGAVDLVTAGAAIGDEKEEAKMRKRLGVDKKGANAGLKEAYEKNFGKGKSGYKPFPWASVLPDGVSSMLGIKENIVPDVKGAPAPSQKDIKVEQNLYFQHDGKDAKKTGDSTKKATEDAMRQMPQGWGS